MLAGYFWTVHPVPCLPRQNEAIAWSFHFLYRYVECVRAALRLAVEVAEAPAVSFGTGK